MTLLFNGWELASEVENQEYFAISLPESGFGREIPIEEFLADREKLLFGDDD